MSVRPRTVQWRFPSPKFKWLHPRHKARHKCFYGGRGGAKSHSAGRLALVLADTRRIRILCTRQVQISIAESMYRLLVNLIDEMGLSDRFVVLRNEIRNKYTGSVFIFRGLNDVKSMEDIGLAIIEEAQQVTREAMDRLIPTMRKRGSQMWWLWNPENEDDAVHAYFLGNPEPPPNTIIQLVNYDDNMFLSEEMRQEADYMRRTNEPLYRHIWKGECKPKGLGWTFINPQWIEHAGSGRVPPLNDILMSRGAIGCDPAFQGVDLCVTAQGHGNRLEEMDEVEYSDSTQIAANLYSRVMGIGRFNCDLGVDCVGTGTGVGDLLEGADYGLSDCLNRLNRKDVEYLPPNAPGMPPVKPEDFDCWRSQAWWLFRCDLEQGNIDLSPLRSHKSWPLLVKEIMAHQMTRKGGKIRITPKEAMRSKDILGWSPGRADALVAWNWVRRRVVDFLADPQSVSVFKDFAPAAEESPASPWI